MHSPMSNVAMLREGVLNAAPARVSRFAAVLTILITFPALGKPAHFTEQQVQSGKQVYSAECAQCHGSNLQGGAGPALKGPKFADSLQFSKMSASQLYRFISEHMPLTQPGSLSSQQYLQVFAYILSQNGFRAGSMPLDQNAISQIDLLPLPGSGSSSNGSK